MSTLTQLTAEPMPADLAQDSLRPAKPEEAAIAAAPASPDRSANEAAFGSDGWQGSSWATKRGR